MSVRSKVLASFADTGGLTSWVTLYTCPAGKTAIAKDWTFVNRSGGARTMTFGVRRSGHEVRIQLGGLVPHLGALTASGRYVVVGPGEQLLLFIGGETVSNNLDAYVAGVELEGVAA